LVTGRSIRLLAAVLGTLVALGGEALSFASGQPASAALLHLAIGLTYLYGGLAIWNHEPANRTGRLMTLVGLSWFIPTVAHSAIPLLNQVGLAFEDTFSIILLALVLAYPSGRLETSVDRWAVAILAVGATALNVVFSSGLLAIEDVTTGLFGGLALATMTATVVVRRWLLAPERSRRELLPVLIAGLVFLATLIINLVRRIYQVSDDVAAILLAAKDLAPAAIPIALLIGFYRQSEHRLQAMVDAIPDRMVRFARDGHFLEPNVPDDALVSLSPDAPVGRRLHQLMFAEAGDAARGSATRALETGLIQGFDFSLDLPSGPREFEARVAPSGPDEVTALVRDFTDQRAAEAEVRRSRARIVEATDSERRRLERDLHDGAQQRLVSVSLALRLLRTRLGATDGPNHDAIVASDEAAVALRTAITELRELARGIHPAILTEAGLGAAITALADRSSVPAAVSSLPDRRMPPAVEATAYFVVSEALANVAKYASATHASIGADCVGSTLRIEVGDNGVGGADGSRGTGIRGLEDRVAAVGGRLTIDSPVGQGTLVVAEIPIG
jgi:signal transduction histidine kinase